MATRHTKTWNFDEYDWVDQYDERMRRHGRLRYDEALARMAELAQVQAGGIVLDIGTGTGNSAIPFLERGCRVVGLDPSERMLEQAREKAGRWRGQFTVQRVNGPFLAIPFGEEAFDVVASAYTIHHLDDDAKRQAVREMKRVLRPAGRIVIADTMFRDAANKAQALAVYPDLEDEYQPLLTTFPVMFEDAGFEVVMDQVGELVWVVVAGPPASPGPAAC